MSLSDREIVKLRLNHLLRSDEFEFRKKITTFCASYELSCNTCLQSFSSATPSALPSASGSLQAPSSLRLAITASSQNSQSPASVISHEATVAFLTARIKQLKLFFAKTHDQVQACYESQFSRHGPLSAMFTEPREKQQRTVPLPQASSAVSDAGDAGSSHAASHDAAGEAAAGAGGFDSGCGGGGAGGTVTAFHLPNARSDGAGPGGAGGCDSLSSAAAIGSDVPLRPLLCEAVEEDVFRRIGPPLLLLFSAANRDRDAAFQRQLWLMRDAQPYHLGIAAPRQPTPASSPQQPDALPLNPPAISEIFPTDADGVCEAERAGLIVVGASPAFDAEAGLRMLELHLNGGGSSGPGNGHSGGAGRHADDGTLSAASSHGSRRLVSASLSTSSFLMSAAHRSDQSSAVTAFSNRSDRPVSDSTPPTAHLFSPSTDMTALSTPPALNAQSPFASPVARTASGSVSSPSLLTAALRDTRSADSRHAHNTETALTTPTAESAAQRRYEPASSQRKTASRTGAAAAMTASARGMSVSRAEDFFAASADDVALRPARSLSFAGSDAIAASAANGVLARSMALPHASLLSASLAASQSFLAANANTSHLGSIARMARKQPLSALPELESESGGAGARLLDFGAAAATAAAGSSTPPSAPSSASRPSSIIVGFTVGAASVSPSKPTASRRIGGGAVDRLNSPRSTLDDCDPRVIDRLSAIDIRASASGSAAPARLAPSGMSPSSPRLSQSQTAYSSVSSARQIAAAAPLSSARAVPAPASMDADADAAAPSNGSMRRFAASPSSPNKYGRQPYAQSFTGSSPLSSQRGSPRGGGGGVSSPLISPSGSSSSVRRSGHLHGDAASQSGTSRSNSGSFRPRPTPPRDLFSSQYADCISELRRLCSLDEHLPQAHSSAGGVGVGVATPRGKTRHLLSILQRLSAASEQGERAMGADDLCSVLSYAILIAGVSHAHGTSNAQSPFALTTQLLFIMTFMDDSAMAAEGGYVLVTVTGLVNYLMGLRWVRHPHTHQRVLIYKPDESQKRAFLPFSADPEFDAPSGDGGSQSAPPPPPQPPARLFRPPIAASSRVARRLATSQKSLPQPPLPPGPAPATAASASSDKTASRRRRSSKTFKLSSLLFWLSSSSSSDASSDSDPASDADLDGSKGSRSRTASCSRRPSMLSETGSSLGSTPSTSSAGSALAAAVASGKASSASSMAAPPSPSPWTSRYADKAPSSRVVRSAHTSPVSVALAASTHSNDDLPTVRVWLQPSAARKATAHHPSAVSCTNPSADSDFASARASEAAPSLSCADATLSVPVSAHAGAAEAVALDLGALIHDSYFQPQTVSRAPDPRASDQSPVVSLPLPRFAVQRVSPILSAAAIAASSSTRASSMSPAAAIPAPAASEPATHATSAASSSSSGGGASASNVAIPGAAVVADASGRESPFAHQSAASSLSSSLPRVVSMGRGAPSGDWRMRNISKFMQQ